MSSVRIVCLRKADEIDLEMGQIEIVGLEHIFTGY